MATDLRRERDEYVAFSFAAADLLLWLDAKASIIAAKGAVQSVCGWDAAGLVGAPILDIIVENDHPIVRRAVASLAFAGRIEPTAVRIRHKAGRMPYAVLGGCALPTMPGRIFLTATLMPPVAAAAVEAMPRDEATGLLDKDTLLDTVLGSASDALQPKRMTLIRVDGLTSAVGTLPEERGQALMTEIGAALRARSIGGDAAGRLGPDEFGLLPSAAGGIEHADAINAEIADAARSAGVLQGLIKTRFGSVDLTPGTLNDRDAAKALAYAVKRFSETRGEGFTLTSLQDEFTAEVASTLSRYDDLRKLIDDERFNLCYQPIVRIDTRELHHYEALSRFPDGQSPYEVITFGEGVGLVEELDLAVCRKALEALSQTTGSVVAVNISGRSIQNARFRESLSNLLRPVRQLHERLIFELTESSKVDQIDEAAAFLRWLRSQNHAVCLDDFGAGAAAYSYLRHFDVDFVKIDGPFLKAAIKKQRDAMLVSSICRLCKDLGCGVIGEMIEDEAESAASAAMGIEFGQGWLYGKPLPTLPSQQAAASVALGRRKGTRESWG